MEYPLLYNKLQVLFSVRSHTWVVGSIPNWSAYGKQSIYVSHINVSMSLFFSLTQNQIKNKKTHISSCKNFKKERELVNLSSKMGPPKSFKALPGSTQLSIISLTMCGLHQIFVLLTFSSKLGLTHKFGTIQL